MIVIERLSETTQDEDVATVELGSYGMADGLFGSTVAIRQRSILAPIKSTLHETNTGSVWFPVRETELEKWKNLKVDIDLSRYSRQLKLHLTVESIFGVGHSLTNQAKYPKQDLSILHQPP
ncbi:hypothetical protein RJT34_19913 [Clitoria ternatea]|uniref:Uncharacterized protein n=1 Tax=Clitoria ternatea TaxID=43366 RepID=A0AAN9P481_CLITE